MSHQRFALKLATAIFFAIAVAGCGDDPLPVVPSPPVEAPASQKFSGDYTLTLEAASDCDSDVPTGQLGPPLALELKRRSYDATVTQAGSRVQIVLTEPRFEDWTENSRRISGTVTKSGANFVIGTDPAGWFSDLIERLPDGSTLQISGHAQTTGSAGVLTGGFFGYFSHSSAAGWLGACGGFKFTLAPR